MNPCQITVSKSYDATINRSAASSTGEQWKKDLVYSYQDFNKCSVQ